MYIVTNSILLALEQPMDVNSLMALVVEDSQQVLDSKTNCELEIMFQIALKELVEENIVIMQNNMFELGNIDLNQCLERFSKKQ